MRNNEGIKKAVAEKVGEADEKLNNGKRDMLLGVAGLASGLVACSDTTAVPSKHKTSSDGGVLNDRTTPSSSLGATAVGSAVQTFSVLNKAQFTGGEIPLTVNMNGGQAVGGGAVTAWGFESTAGAMGFNGDRVAPGPVIELIQGESVLVRFSSGMPHTIHWHGLDVDTANDGVPATSGYVGQSMTGNFGRVGGYTALGPVTDYRFTAPHAGTYIYHCHVDTVLHMEMGMYGVVIVRPTRGNTFELWDGGPQFTREYIWQLHTFDSLWHPGGGMAMMNAASGPRTVRHRPNVFMINGRDDANLFSDPSVAISGAANDRVLIRLVNLGYQPAKVNLADLPFEVVASDGRPLGEPGGTPLSFVTDTLMVMPGERYDIILTLPANLSTPANAVVDYYSIRGDVVLGQAVTTISIA